MDSCKVLFISEKPLFIEQTNLITHAMINVGILDSQYKFITISDKSLIVESKANVLVPIGEKALNSITGMSGINKWHCSIIMSISSYGSTKCIPMLDPRYIFKQWSEHFYLNLACKKIRDEMNSPALISIARIFIKPKEVSYIIQSLRDYSYCPIAIDFEFSYGQINTVGFAKSEKEAIAIRALPEFYSKEDFHKLWIAIANILENSQPKYIHHAGIESAWANRYGIKINNIEHDTMLAQKLIYPELAMDLANIGRIYTPFPYWKDDNDDWSRISDWNSHLDYNCKDTTATFAAVGSQRRDLEAAGLSELFKNHIMPLQTITSEMGQNGLKVSSSALLSLKEKLESERTNLQRIVDEHSESALGYKLNIRSHKQVKALFEAMKLTTIKRSDGKISTDKNALLRMKKKHPKSEIIKAIIGLGSSNHKLANYVSFKYDQYDNRMHYNLIACGNEIGQVTGYGSVWGNGFNPQETPYQVRNIFIPDPGMALIQISLKNPELHFFAFQAPELNLINMIKEDDDLDRKMAGIIFNKMPDMVNEKQIRFSRHAIGHFNYGVSPKMFAEIASSSDHIEIREARDMIERYMTAFPNIRKYQERIKQNLYNKRSIKTYLGRRRDFFGRINDQTFKEAFAYEAKSLTCDFISKLAIRLYNQREYLGLGHAEGGKFLLHNNHSMLIQANPDRIAEISALCKDYEAWQPKLFLPGGWEPIKVKVEMGLSWLRMEEY